LIFGAHGNPGAFGGLEDAIGDPQVPAQVPQAGFSTKSADFKEI
jgi:hypothetical protein